MKNIANTIIECPSCGTNYSTIDNNSCFNCDKEEQHLHHNSNEDDYMLFMH